MQLSTSLPISDLGSRQSDEPKPAARRGHRTQAERRAETRTALLEATVECLATHGYAKTTTGRIADLANVSRGAQTLYFPTRAELLWSAVTHLAEQRVAAFRERLSGGRMSIEDALDALWDEHQGPTFQAALELWVASRTDAELRDNLHQLERKVGNAIAGAAHDALGEIADRPGFSEDLVFALATIRGIAIIQVSNGSSDRSIDRLWAQTRTRLAHILA